MLNLIDTLNPELRSKEQIGTKIRVREFYHIKPEEIYFAFESMAEVTDTSARLHLWCETKEEIEENKEAIIKSKNRHCFKNISFHSNLTEKDYYSKTNEDGTLGIYEKYMNIEVPSNSNLSKRQMLYSSLEDLGEDVSSANTLYQLEHKLEKNLISRK